MASRPLYRTRQFFGALRPRVRRRELREASARLGPQLTPLFLSMSRRDQRHCLDVCEKLRAWGCEDGEVLTAALLHDAGKGSMARSVNSAVPACVQRAKVPGFRAIGIVYAMARSPFTQTFN